MKRAVIVFALMIMLSGMVHGVQQPVPEAAKEGDLWKVGQNAYAICYGYETACKGEALDRSLGQYVPFVMYLDIQNKEANFQGIEGIVSGKIKFGFFKNEPKKITEYDGKAIAKKIGRGGIVNGRVSPSDQPLCKNMYRGDKKNMNDCAMRAAIIKNDEKQCSRIADINTKGRCYLEIAKNKGQAACKNAPNAKPSEDIQSCYFFNEGDYSFKECCYFQVAKAVGNTEPCNEIKRESAYEACAKGLTYLVSKM